MRGASADPEDDLAGSSVGRRAEEDTGAGRRRSFPLLCVRHRQDLRPWFPETRSLGVQT